MPDDWGAELHAYHPDRSRGIGDLFTNWGIGNHMDRPGRHRRVDTTETTETHMTDTEKAPSDSPEMARLIEARDALERARQQPTRWRKRQRDDEVAAADRALQDAAMAAHGAGIGWTQIGDALGMKRAQPITPATRTPGGELRLIRGAAYQAKRDDPTAQKAN